MSSFEYNHGMARAPGPIHVYGVTWSGGSSTALTRTDDAANFSNPVPYVDGASSYGSPFDNLMPWSGMVKVNDVTVGELVEIPKFWYKLTKTGSALSIQIADGPKSGFSVSPAHMNRGDGTGERDVVYIGRYHCSSYGAISLSGYTPIVRTTRADARNGIHNYFGAAVWQMDFAMRFTIWLLYIVEFADWNSQAKIGYGSGADAIDLNGRSNAIPYHTGTPYSSRTTYGAGVQYRWIEGLWDNVPDMIDGCYVYQGIMYIILNPSNFSDNSNGTAINTTALNDSGAGYYTTNLQVSTSVFPLFYPSAYGGSNSTYIPDKWKCSMGSSTSYWYPYSGGFYNQGYWNKQDYGLFFVMLTNPNNEDYAMPGFRLMVLPTANSGITEGYVFSIGDYSAICTIGMTWQQWVNSVYNGLGCTIANGYVQLSGDGVVIYNTSPYNTVAPTDTIINNYNYYLD